MFFWKFRYHSADHWPSFMTCVHRLRSSKTRFYLWWFCFLFIPALTRPPWSWASWPRWGPCRSAPPGGWWSWPAAWGSRREPPSAWPSPRWHALPAGQSRSRGVWPRPSRSAPPIAASSEPGMMGNRGGKLWVTSASTWQRLIGNRTLCFFGCWLWISSRWNDLT